MAYFNPRNPAVRNISPFGDIVSDFQAQIQRGLAVAKAASSGQPIPPPSVVPSVAQPYVDVAAQYVPGLQPLATQVPVTPTSPLASITSNPLLLYGGLGLIAYLLLK